MKDIFTNVETRYVLGLLVSLICGILIGAERELKKKPAGVSTQTLVIGGSMTFAFLSQILGAGDPARIAAQIVSGVGFLGAGIILRSENGSKVTNVTTAASIWFSASIGMAIGFKYYVIALSAALFAIIISRIPKIDKFLEE